MWTPGHTGTDGGNEAAHAVAAQAGGLDYSLSTPHPSSSPNLADLNPYLEMLRAGSPSRAFMHYIRVKLKTDSKRRLLEATPAPLLSDKGGLTRQQEIFLNKVMANAAYTPHVLDKWIRPRQVIANTSPRCPHCQELCRADLHHLIWICSAFSRGRTRIQHLPRDDISALGNILQSNDEAQKALANYASISGLFRVV